MVIAISGFLSENDDQKESWDQLKRYCEEHEVPLFGVSWQAQTSDDVHKIAQEGINTLKDNIKTNKSFSMSSFKKFINVENAITLAKVAYNTTIDTSALFIKARNNA